MTTTGNGIAAQNGFAIEGTKNTRQAPNRSIPFVQESMTSDQEFIRSQGLRAGRRLGHSKVLGQKTVGGSLNFEVQTETFLDLLLLCVGGSATTTGSDPYEHELEGGALPSATFQLGRPTNDITDNLIPFDYLGCMVNSWTLSVNPGEIATIQVELFAWDEVQGQTLYTYAESSTITPLTFRHLTVALPDASAQCFDSFSITGNNNLGRSFKSCEADAGRATIRENGMRTITGNLPGDFDRITEYNRYLAGTAGAVTAEFDAGSDAKLLLTMNVFYTGDTPNVGGPETVKKGLPFEVVSPTSDAAAFTVTLTNTDSNA